MAVTRIIPLHVGGKRSLAAALKKTVDYVKNPEKTDGGEYTAPKRAAKPRKLCTAAAMIEQPHRGLVHLRQMR